MIQLTGADAWLMILEFLLIGFVCGLIIGYSYGYKYAKAKEKKNEI